MNENKETVIVDIIENFANLPKSDSVSINVQACGHEWEVRVLPGVDASRNDDGCVYITLWGDDEHERTEENPLIANARFRSKTAIESFSVDSCLGNFVPLQRRRVIENELNDDGTFTFEIDIEITTAKEIRTVWYPELNIYNNDIAKKLYRSIDETSDVPFLVGQPKKEIKAHKNVLAIIEW